MRQSAGNLRVSTKIPLLRARITTILHITFYILICARGIIGYMSLVTHFCNSFMLFDPQVADFGMSKNLKGRGTYYSDQIIGMPA